jgi:predicted AlkP superfamily phosphohydrolase/phosphomutase
MKSRREFLARSALGVAGMCLGAGCSGKRLPSTNRKVLILGFDGLDPVIVGRLMREGRLPAFAQVAQDGHFGALGTTVPPLSPVAWATFTTGMNPGGHGVFDFIHRDPATMTPYLSTARAEAPARTIQLGSWVIPLSSGSLKLLRQGETFWQRLEERGVPTVVARAPANFPPATAGGQQLSGMGTPDLQGTYGVFSFFTDDPAVSTTGVSGGEIVRVARVNHRVAAQLLGPRNTFRADAPSSAIDFTVFVDPSRPLAKIAIQGQEIVLEAGEWGPWLHVRFDLVPYVQSVSGIVRFYLKQTHPHLKLYATPVNIDPSAPALPISSPESYAHDLFEELGPFYTQGMPHDTKALSQGLLDEAEFLQQAAIVFDEQSRLFSRELSRFRRGFLFLYSDRVDQLAHMFWRTMDRDHPRHEAHGRFANVIEEAYRDIDRLLGQALTRVDDDTTLLVLSDHGFAPFSRAFNLNTWLHSEGYLSLAGPLRQPTAGAFEAVQWGQSRAYGLGLNGLYLNVNGREREGAVAPGSECDRLRRELGERLLAVRDPATGERAIRRVYAADDIYAGAARALAPDLVVGYARGYRVSWESVLGGLTPDVFSDNSDKWSGDHAMAADLVPGVLLSNRRLRAVDPTLADIAPTVLSEFGVDRADQMEGRVLF